MGELIQLVDDDDFKGFLLRFVELLATGDFLDELLYNDAIVVLGLRRCHFDVVQ